MWAMSNKALISGSKAIEGQMFRAEMHPKIPTADVSNRFLLIARRISVWLPSNDPILGFFFLKRESL